MKTIFYYLSGAALLCALFIAPLSINAQGNGGGASGQQMITGDVADVSTNPSGGILLMGGAGDNDDAMTWMLQKADGGDVVVLRATGTDAYNDYLFNLGPAVNSVETLIIDTPAKASDPVNEQTIRNAEAVFIAGGDQFDYVSIWKDSPIEDALNYLINTKGVVIGGTSAGCAIQGRVYFDAANGTVTSDQVLANPYDNNATLQRDNFLNHSILANTITDTHYDNPDRKGRHTSFLARMVKDWGLSARGIGVDEYTAVCVEPNGIAKVFGDANYEDYAYFLQSYGGTPENCTSGNSLTWNRGGEAVKVYKIQGTADGSRTFNLNDWETGNGGIWEDFYVQNGVLNITSPSTAPVNGGGGTTCDVPAALSASNVGETSADISWGNSGATSYDYRYREVGTTSWITASTTANSATLSGLNTATDYEFQVRSDCGATSSAYSSSSAFTTQTSTGGGGGPTNYCAASGNASSEWIASVDIRDIYNQTGSDGGYGDYTNVSSDLEAGQSYGIFLRPGFSGSSYTEYFEVWIDFDQSGTFESSESVYYGRSRRGRSISGTVSVPSNALNGNTRMRVAMSYDGYPPACGDVGYGEVEDYTVTIFNGASSRSTAVNHTNSVSALDATVYPNPSKDVFKVTGNFSKAGIKVFDLSGKIIFESTAIEKGQPIATRGWKPGMYVVELISEQQVERVRIIVVK